MRSTDDVAAPDPPSAQSGYRPHLDGIRAIAVVAVICFHLGYGWIPGGFVGVDVFFVLSGYLITGLLLTELEGRSGLRLGRFYARRARRLLPASILVLVAVALAGLAVLDLAQRRSLGWDTTFAALYSANWRFAFVGGDYFAPGDVPSPLVHYWSLAVEEQFYLLWPAMLLAAYHAARRLRGKRWLTAVTAAIGVLTAASLWLSISLTGRPSAYYGTHTRAYQLLAGALLVALLRRFPVRPRPGPATTTAGTVAAVAALAVLGRLAHTIPDATRYPGTAAVAVTAATVVLIAAVDLVPWAPVGRVLGAAPAAAIGRLSYSLYIWHWPVIVLLPGLTGWRPLTDHTWGPPLLAAVTVVIALGSYLLVERPVRFRVAPGAPPLRVVALGLGSSLVIAMLAYPVFQPRSEFAKRALDAVHDIATERPCPYTRAAWDAEGPNPRPCITRRGAPGAPVIAVVGDSHAQQWAPGILVAAARNDATVVRVTRRACAPVDVTPTMRSETNQLIVERDCTEWRRRVFPKLIAEYDPDAIFLVTRSNVRSFEVDGKEYEVGGPGHLEAWTAGLERTLDMLTAGTGTVVLSTILPTMPWRVPACLAAEGRDEGCDMPVSSDTAVAPFNEVIRGLDGSHRGRVRVIDTIPIPCPDGTCQAMIGDQIVFRDDNHLAQSFVRSRAGQLARLFAAVGAPL